MKSTKNAQTKSLQLPAVCSASSLLVLGIAVAAAGLLYLGMMWKCTNEREIVQEEIVVCVAPDPVA